MATVTLVHPPRGEFRFRYRTVLDGITVSLQFRWDERDQSWYFDMGNASLVAIVRGIRCVIATDILAPYQYNPDVPPGVLDVVDTSNTNLEAERDEFGTRVVLRYTEAIAGS